MCETFLECFTRIFRDSSGDVAMGTSLSGHRFEDVIVGVLL